MSDPVRFLDPKSGAPFARSLLQAGLDASDGGDGGMEPPAGAKEHVWSALSSSLGGALVGGAIATSTAPVAASSAPVAVSHAPATAVGAKPVASVAVKSGAKLVLGKWIWLSALAVGAVGAAVYSARPSATPNAESVSGPTVEVEANSTTIPTTTTTTTTTATPTPTTTTSTATSTTTSTSTSTPTPTPTPTTAGATKGTAGRDAHKSDEASAAAASTGNTLVEESTAFTEAKKKLRAGDASGALGALDDMQKRFGGGGLTQERTALLVEALAAAGQRDRASQIADAFLASYPNSSLTDRVRPFATH